jgi:ADP-heptose:LPS heptosyltransferase
VTRSNSAVRALEDAAMRALLPVLRAAGALRPRRGAPAGPRRALIVKWCCLGDAVVSLYAIREYKRRHPGISLEALVSSRIAEVYRGAPWIDTVHVLPVTGHRLARELADPGLWKRLLGLVFRLRGRRFAEMVDLELYRAHGALLKRLLGIPWSRGFSVEGALDKGHDFQVDLPRDMPEWKCFYRVLGLEPPERAPEPLYARAAPRGRGGKRRIGMVYGSSFNWPQKKWPWEHFARLARDLHGQGHEVVLFGSVLERGESRRIREAAGVPVEDTSGRLDYAGLLEAVAGCDLVVGNDTGTLHLAAACGVPTVTLFGPTDPRKWNPLTSTAVYLEDLPCRPCYYLGSMPACGHFDCLRKLQPSLVAEKIRLRLAEESLFPGNGRA